MATKQTIRKNIITGEWEHYVDVPLFNDYHWVPGIFNYYGDFPPTETTHSLVRNGEDFILSYEDLYYEDYEIVTKRHLPEYDDVTNLYDIKFDELYTPKNSLNIVFSKRNPEYEFINIEAVPHGGYPYRHPNVHYQFRWKAIEFDGRYIQNFNNTKNSYTLEGIGIGKYELTITDANRNSYSKVVNITKSDLLKNIHVGPITTPKPFSANLWFWSDDTSQQRGYLRVTVDPTGTEGPYTLEWRRGTIPGLELRTEIVESFSVENTVYLDYYLGWSDYSIIITSNDGQVATSTITVNESSFPSLDPNDPNYYLYDETEGGTVPPDF